MKTIFRIIVFSALICAAFTSCQDKIEPETPDSHSQEPGIVFDLQLGGCQFGGGNSSKAIKADWAADDVVFLFFDNLTTAYLRLTNTSGSSSSWSYSYEGTNVDDLHNLIRTQSSAKVNAINVPFADADVKATFADSKWTINTGDVFFTTDFGTVTIKESETVADEYVLSGEFDLSMYPGYVQVFIDKDSRFPASAQYHCNMLDRYDKVELVMDGTTYEATYTPVQAADNEHFDVRVFNPSSADGLVFYGIIKDVASRPDTTIFKVDGGFNKDEYGVDTTPLTDPVVFLYTPKKNIEGNKAYKLAYQNETIKWGRWTRMLWAKFEIAEGKCVRFTPTNINVSENLDPHWRFYDSQNFVRGMENADVYDGYGRYNKYYDLFQWGASGVNSSSSTISYTVKPISYTENATVQYIALPPGAHGKGDETGYRKDLFTVKDCAFNYSPGASAMDDVKGYVVPTEGDDWGSNIIEYNYANVFRTLSANQWEHLFNCGKYVFGWTKIDDIYGWVIGLSGTVESSYTSVTWKQAELSQGFVFFPHAGMRKACGWPLTGLPATSEMAYEPSLPSGSSQALRDLTRMEGWRYWTCSVRDNIPGLTGNYAVIVEYRYNSTGVMINGSDPDQGRPVRLIYDVKNIEGE